MKRKNLIILAAAILCLGGVVGISAYFTATDTVTNTFKIGKEVDVVVEEPNYEDEQDITPNETIVKDPQVTNEGDVDAFVFVSVEVPTKNIITANVDGTRNEQAWTQLFSYETNDGWVQVGDETVDEDNEVTTIMYAWGTEDEMTALEAGGTTGTLFDSVTMCNAIEGQGLSETMPKIVINAFAIQTEGLGENGNETSPIEVLALYLNQNAIVGN